MGDGCDLECVANFKPKYHEFVGPVKIVIVDEPPSAQCRKEWGSALVALACLSMGWVTLSILFYTFGLFHELTVNAHIFLGTVGMLIPIGILNFNQLSGPTIVLKVSERKIEHMITQMLGLLVGLFSTVAMVNVQEYKFEKLLTAHGVAGGLASIFGILSLFVGMMTYAIDPRRTSKCIRTLHMWCGVLCFSSSSICFVLGVLKPSIALFFEPDPAMMYFLVGVCIYYTIVVIYTPITRRH